MKKIILFILIITYLVIGLRLAIVGFRSESVHQSCNREMNIENMSDSDLLEQIEKRRSNCIHEKPSVIRGIPMALVRIFLWPVGLIWFILSIIINGPLESPITP